MIMDEISKKFEEYKRIRHTLRRDCVDYLKKVTKGKRIDFDPVEAIAFVDESICIYNPNCEVYGIFLEDNELYLDTEESNYFSVELLDTDELVSITQRTAIQILESL